MARHTFLWMAPIIDLQNRHVRQFLLGMFSPILCCDALQGFGFLIAAYMEIYYIDLIIVHLLTKNTCPGFEIGLT